MDRKTGQFVVMGAVLTLIVVLVWNMYNLDVNFQTSVTGPQGGYVKNYSGYFSGQIPSSKVPAKTAKSGNLFIHTFVYGFKEPVVLNALPLPVISSMTDDVRWTADPNNFKQITLADSSAVITYFFAPEEEGSLKFKLEKKENGAFVPIANFIYKIQSPLTQQADANSDGVFDFKDLLSLIQNWDKMGSKATQMLAIVLSQYEKDSSL